MTLKGSRPFNIFVPNLLNLCIDGNDHEISGRLYHCYSVEPETFTNVIELIQKAETLFDAISFPQASTKTRSFVPTETVYVTKKPDMVVNQRGLLEHTGRKGTFLVSVRFRQNSTWQGDFQCMETGEVEGFRDVLELLRKIEEKMK